MRRLRGCSLRKKICASREFVSCIARTDVSHWLRGSAVLCIPHGTKAPQAGPACVCCPESTLSSRTAASSWRKSCNICATTRSRTGPAGAQLGGLPSSLFRNVVYIPKGGSMLRCRKAVKVCIYLSEGSKHHGVPTYSSVLDFLFLQGHLRRNCSERG